MAQQRSRSRQAPPPGLRPQWLEQSIQRPRTGAQQALAHFTTQALLVLFIGRHSFGPHPHQTPSAGVIGSLPDRLERGQQIRRFINPRTPAGVAGRADRLHSPQRSNGRFAMIPQQLLRLIQQLPFVLRTGLWVTRLQFAQNFFPCSLTHCFIHSSHGNS